jgi:ribosomal protein S12 methylthiotransferase
MKVGLVSLGCPKNLVDSEVMLGLARTAGHEVTSDPSAAEVIVVNTCAFIDSARRESVDAILEMAQHKHHGTCRRLIVAGCLAERYRDELQKEIPEIDAVLGTNDVPCVLSAVGGSGSAASSAHVTFYRSMQVAASKAPAARPTYLYDASTPRLLTTPRHVAYIKIAEGCDYKCAFCIIPTLRGAYRSRTTASVVDEARALADRGVKEVLLVSQDTTFYGVDRRERGALARLLAELNGVAGLEWIRLLYLYPTTIDDRTLGAMADLEKVCKYVDLPLQHASDRILRRMNRPGSERQYDSLLAGIRRRVPGVALRTTFIVGFPGETGADVDQLCAFVTRQEFDHVGVFTYSHEEGTTAYRLEDEVPAEVKAARQTRVMRVQQTLIERKNRARVGEHTRVLIDGPSSEHDLVLQGRLSTQAPEIDGVVYLTECDPARFAPGDMVCATIVGARSHDFIARAL